MTSNDAVNASDTNGSASFGSITDWTGFENKYRGWGNDGSAFPNSDNRGWCTTGTCRIWDWSLLQADSALRGVLVSLPTGSDTFTHTWHNGSTTTFLRHALEILGDGIGNDDGLCESGETCVYLPNIGAYQGHGNLIDAGAFTDGAVTGVTLKRYGTNGY